MSDSWLNVALEKARPYPSDPSEDRLITKLLDTIDTLNLPQAERQLALGAAFDLLISAEYYGSIAHIGWLYCESPEPILFYPYTNICPHCVLAGDFVFHKANKPKSGAIGASTSRLLSRFIGALLDRNDNDEEIEMIMMKRSKYFGDGSRWM